MTGRSACHDNVSRRTSSEPRTEKLAVDLLSCVASRCAVGNLLGCFCLAVSVSEVNCFP